MFSFTNFCSQKAVLEGSFSRLFVFFQKSDFPCVLAVTLDAIHEILNFDHSRKKQIAL